MREGPAAALRFSEAAPGSFQGLRSVRACSLALQPLTVWGCAGAVTASLAVVTLAVAPLVAAFLAVALLVAALLAVAPLALALLAEAPLAVEPMAEAPLAVALLAEAPLAVAPLAVALLAGTQLAVAPLTVALLAGASLAVAPLSLEALAVAPLAVAPLSEVPLAEALQAVALHKHSSAHIGWVQMVLPCLYSLGENTTGPAGLCLHVQTSHSAAVTSRLPCQANSAWTCCCVLTRSQLSARRCCQSRFWDRTVHMWTAHAA